MSNDGEHLVCFVGEVLLCEHTPPAAKTAEHVHIIVGDLYRFLVDMCLSIQMLYLFESSMAFYSSAVGIP